MPSDIAPSTNTLKRIASWIGPPAAPASGGPASTNPASTSTPATILVTGPAAEKFR